MLSVPAGPRRGRLPRAARRAAAEVAEATGTALAGGDLTRGADARTRRHRGRTRVQCQSDFVTRAGAQPGDALVLTGELGGAAAGLSSSRGRSRALRFAEDAAAALARLASSSRPPRLRAGRALAAAGARAMIDLSDGLGGDAGHLAAASGVGLRIDADALPLADGVDGGRRRRRPRSAAARGLRRRGLRAARRAARREPRPRAARRRRGCRDRPDRRGRRRRGGRDQAARGPVARAGRLRPAGLSAGSSSASSSRTPRRRSIASATSAGFGL